MPIDSSFGGVEFKIALGSHTIPQKPKWIDRNETRSRTNVDFPINGVPSAQKVGRKWKPLTLVFSPENTPGALITQPMLDAFTAAQESGALKTLTLEGSTHRVLLDAASIEVEELTATDEVADADRLYSGVIRFWEFLS